MAFRELSFSECGLVAGGLFGSTYDSLYNSTDGGGGGGGGSTGGGGDGGGTPPPPSTPSLTMQLLALVPSAANGGYTLDWGGSGGYNSVGGGGGGGGSHFGGYDSTDDASGYFWREMSTGTLDWVMMDARNDVNHDIQYIWDHASTEQQALMGVAAYLAANGLGHLVNGQVDSSFNESNGFLGGQTVYNGDEIVVTAGSWQHYNPTIVGPNQVAAVSWIPSGSGGGSAGPTAPSGTYVTSDASAVGNAYADAHVVNNGTTADDLTVYKKAHDDLAKLFDKALLNPNELVDLGNGIKIPAAQAVLDLSKATIEITDQALRDINGNLSIRPDHTAVGAQTRDNGNGTYTIQINPAVADIQGFMNGFINGTGLNFVIFHELGHVLEGINNPSAYTYSNVPANFPYEYYLIEGSANTAGKSLEEFLGLALMTDLNGNISPPDPGYNDTPQPGPIVYVP